jgi:hypothetical protein
MIAKLVASTEESLCRSGRRKYSQDCSRSRSSQGRILSVPGLWIASFHASATSRLALRSRNVNVSVTTGWNCGASRPPRATAPTVLALANGVGPVTGRGRSRPRCRRKPLPLAASGLVVNAIVFDGHPLRLAVPNGNRACGLRLQHDLSDRFADQRRDTAPPSAPRPCAVRRALPCEGNLGLYTLRWVEALTVRHRGLSRTPLRDVFEPVSELWLGG